MLYRPPTHMSTRAPHLTATDCHVDHVPKPCHTARPLTSAPARPFPQLQDVARAAYQADQIAYKQYLTAEGAVVVPLWPHGIKAVVGVIAEPKDVPARRLRMNTCPHAQLPLCHMPAAA